MNNQSENSRLIYMLQIASLSWIWIFVTGVSLWIIRLIVISIRLQDFPNASVIISIVVIPIFLSLASVLTYVFVGLQKNKHSQNKEELGDEK